MAFDPDGCRVASASADGTVRVWDVTADQEAILCHGHSTEVGAVAFSPDGRRVASLGRDGAVEVCDARSGQEASPPSGGMLPRLWVYSGAGSEMPQRPLRLKAPLRAIAFSPEGDRIVAISVQPGKDTNSTIWDAHTGKPVATANKLILDKGSTPLCMNGAWLVTVQPGMPGVTKDSPQAGPSLWVTDVLTGTVMHRFKDKRFSLSITGSAVRADGQRLALGREDGSLDVWDTASGDFLFQSRGHMKPVTGLAFRAEGTFASASLDGVVKVWDGSGRQLATIQGHADSVNAMGFSPDGRRLATASADRTVKVWDIQTGQEVLTLTGHVAGVEAVAFDPGGRRITSAGADRTVRVWSAEERPPEHRRRAQTRNRPGWHRRQATEAEKRGDLNAATFHLDWLIAQQPGEGVLHRWRGFVRARQGQRAGAAADFATAVNLNRGDRLALTAHARTCLEQGDSDAYRSTCTALVSLLQENQDTDETRVALRACLLAPNAVADFKLALKLADTLATEKRDFDALQLRGGLRLRAGRPQDAIKDLKDADAARQPDYDPVHADFLLALAHHQLKQPQEARRWFDKGTAWMEKHSPHKENWGWLIWLELDLLRREATAALKIGP